MGDVREKLVELLIEATRKWGCQIGLYGCMADHLIANGVTIPIRCKECNHWLKDVPGCTDAIGRCRFGNYMVGANGYCVYGERKEND